MKWINNINRIIKENKTGICPHCKSSNTDYMLSIVNKDTKMGYGIVWCNECKKAKHISRIMIEEENVKEIPKDLAYD